MTQDILIFVRNIPSLAQEVAGRRS